MLEKSKKIVYNVAVRRIKMKYVKQFAIIITVSFLGELLSHFIPLPIPASIWGLLIMLCLLTLRILPLDSVKDTAKLLVSLMQIMFIPAAVALILSLEEIKNALPAIIISIAIVTPIVFFTSGKVTDVVIALSSRKEKKEDDVK